MVILPLRLSYAVFKKKPSRQMTINCTCYFPQAISAKFEVRTAVPKAIFESPCSNNLFEYLFAIFDFLSSSIASAGYFASPEIILIWEPHLLLRLVGT